MADIIAIGTALPAHCHKQSDILGFMQEMYGLDGEEKRKLKFLYDHSDIGQRYSVLDDYGLPEEVRTFFPAGKNSSLPPLEKRMEIYEREAPALSVKAVKNCISGIISPQDITHLITVSCTGMSAPGLDLSVMSELELRPDIFRTSVNFMGCYAAIHALKIAKMICDTEPGSNVVIVCTELCTLHFHKRFTEDNAASALLFADGSAAVLVSNRIQRAGSLQLNGFYSYVKQKGSKDMAWQLHSEGFLMTLSGYVPELIREDIHEKLETAVGKHGLSLDDITHWCMHPGGKRILDLVQKQMKLPPDALGAARKILKQYGNMSSPTVLFVLKEIMEGLNGAPARVLGTAFGPGLTMETFIAESR